MAERSDYALIDDRGVYAITMAEPDQPMTAKQRRAWDRDLARFCADGIRRGHRIERMSTDEAVRRLCERLGVTRP
ncbi:hypothetical protein DA075_10115 [Methylobacterium currus]|uniref:Uncharacterized protein n=1 Tax=Methylobacterium currus TaxID=2051553 RepID=A0A2R4WI74_9HYPH|nr:hypothetical protein [Methylobacterium currus]AWB21225.1 hypothetical protein DA075_10115 [Methylobacterium currus]